MIPVALAIDLGGTKVEAGLVTADGTVVASSRHRRPTGPDSSSEQLAEAVTGATMAALASVGPEHELIGAGIGAAGPINVAVAASLLRIAVSSGGVAALEIYYNIW